MFKTYMSYRLVKIMHFTDTEEQRRELQLEYRGVDGDGKPIYMLKTRKGLSQISVGDYVALNIKGEAWIIDKETIDEMYVEVDEQLMERARQESEEAQMKELEQYSVAESEEEEYINEQENGGITNA